MAVTNKVATDIAVKRLSGKAHTNANFGLGSEPYGSTVQTLAEAVFAETLPNDPAQTLWLIQSSSVSDPGTVMWVELDVVPFGSEYQNTTDADAGDLADQGEGGAETYHAYALVLSSSFDTNVVEATFNSNASTDTTWGSFPFVGDSYATGSRGKLQIVPEFASNIPAGVPTSDNPYTPKLYGTDGSYIGILNGIDYYVDTYSGILFVQDPADYGTAGSPNIAATVPGKVLAFIYVGKFQDAVTFGANDVNFIVSGSDEGFAVGNDDTINFVSGSAGITVESNSSAGTITIGESTDNVTFNNITATGDIIAQNYIVSSSVTYMTQSFSSGSTIFGNSNDDTHEFTGSLLVLHTGSNYGIDITGSGVIIDSGDISISASGDITASGLYLYNDFTALDGGVTVTTNTDPELYVDGNITASGDISASGLLFASASDDGGTVTTIAVAMYDTASGRFYYTGSSALGDTTELEASSSAGIYISASEGTGFSLGLIQSASFTSGAGEGLTVTAGADNNIEFELVGVLSSSQQIATDISGAIHAASSSLLTDYGLLSSSQQIATDISGAINIATGSVLSDYGLLSGSQQIATDISGAIGAATASLSESIVGTTYEVEVTNGGTPGDIVIGLPNEVRISSSLQVGTNNADPDDASITTSHTGEFNLINANATTINFGGAATTINMGVANGTVSIAGSASIAGDLTVQGAVTSINTTNLFVEDQFILLNSGAASTTDTGIIVQTNTTQNQGSALYWDTGNSRWEIDFAGANAASNSATGDAAIVTVKAADSSTPSAPYMGAVDAGIGQMYVDTGDNDGDGNTIWIYA